MRDDWLVDVGQSQIVRDKAGGACDNVPLRTLFLLRTELSMSQRFISFEWDCAGRPLMPFLYVLRKFKNCSLVEGAKHF